MGSAQVPKTGAGRAVRAHWWAATRVTEREARGHSPFIRAGLAGLALGAVVAAILLALPARHFEPAGYATPAALDARRPLTTPKPKTRPKPKAKPAAKAGISTGPSSAPTVIVAVVGGAADLTHPALVGHLWSNPAEIPGNGIDDDKNGIVDDVAGANFPTNTGDVGDDTGHGTHVSGIIAMLDPRAKIMVLKAGDGHFIDLGAAAKAIYYAVAHGARIINLSWAFLSSDASLEQAIGYAGAHNVLVVVAAGNFGTDNDLRPTYPASYLSNTLVSVAATCDGQTLASFSNFGKLSVNVAAPGCNITSTLPGGAYGALSGTSMAAPGIAGVAALLLEQRPGTSAQDLERDILGGAQPSPALAGVLSSGASLDTAGALAALSNPDRAAPTNFTEQAPSRSFTVQQDPTYYYQAVTFSWTQSHDPDLAGYKLILDGNAIAAATASAITMTAKIGPGTHTWSVVAYDRSGNTTTASP